MGKYNKTSFT